MTALSPGPAPTLVADWFTLPFVTVVVLIAAVWFAVYTIRAIRHDRLNAYVDDPACDNCCQIGDCHNPATTTYDRHPTGRIWVCTAHAAMVQDWTGTPGRPVERVYDQDLDGTDLAKWEKEMPA